MEVSLSSFRQKAVADCNHIERTGTVLLVFPGVTDYAFADTAVAIYLNQPGRPVPNLVPVRLAAFRKPRRLATPAEADGGPTRKVLEPCRATCPVGG